MQHRKLYTDAFTGHQFCANGMRTWGIDLGIHWLQVQAEWLERIMYTNVNTLLMYLRCILKQNFIYIYIYVYICIYIYIAPGWSLNKAFLQQAGRGKMCNPNDCLPWLFFIIWVGSTWPQFCWQGALTLKHIKEIPFLPLVAPTTQ